MSTEEYTAIPGMRVEFPEKEEILRSIEEILDSGEVSQGKYLKSLEGEFAKFVGCKYAVGVNSGGTALELALKALQIKGREVIVPTDTFVATANSVIQAGGTPVFADISAESLSLTIETIRPLLSSKTAAVIVVHMFGIIDPKHEKLHDFCREQGIPFIEDAAHAHGAMYHGEYAGNISDIGCFSFYATKIMNCGEGGILTLNDEALYHRLLQLRNHGKSLTEPIFELVSNNYRLGEIPAAMLLPQLRGLKQNIERRQEIARIYQKGLTEISSIELYQDYPEQLHSYWRYPILLKKDADRDEVQKLLLEKYNVRVNWMYEPLCHLQPVFKDFRRDALPVAENIIQRQLCLPCYPSLTFSEAERVVTGLREVLT